MIQGRNLESECIYSASRSSGPGGQHVNKVNTRVELRFDVKNSRLLSDIEKQVIMQKLASRITQEGVLILVSQTERSQYDNKEKVTKRCYKLLEKALTPVKKRIPTRPTAASKARRLDTKKIKSVKKIRRKVDLE
jgi:ribosome-associated protein